MHKTVEGLSFLKKIFNAHLSNVYIDVYIDLQLLQLKYK